MAVNCPRCGRLCNTGAGLSMHWTNLHDGPLPDDIDTSLSDEHKQNIRDGFDDEAREKVRAGNELNRKLRNGELDIE